MSEYKDGSTTSLTKEESEELKQIKEALQFVEDTPYINEVLNGVTNVDKLDKNSLYEIVYLEEKLDKWLTGGISNQDTRLAVQDLYNKLHVITSSISDELVEKALKANVDTSRTKKLNIVKYGDKTKERKLVDKSSGRAKFRDPMTIVAIKSLTKILLAGICLMLLHYLGTMENYATLTLGDASVQQTQVIIFIGRLLVTLIVIWLTLSSVINIMYAALPAFRGMNNSIIEKGGSSIVSNETIKTVELAESMPYTYVYRKADLMDKLDTSNVLLNNMILYLRDYKYKFDVLLSKDMSLLLHYGNTGNMMHLLEGIKDKAEKSKGLDKIRTLAKVELIYDDFHTVIDRIEGGY